MQHSMTNMLRSLLLLAVLGFGLLQPLSAAPGLLNYQGRLTDSLGDPVTDPVEMTFSFWNDPSGGSQLGGFSSTIMVTPNADGYYAAIIGEEPDNLIPDTIFSHPEVYLNVNINGEDLRPRRRITSVPYAAQAEQSLSMVSSYTAAEAISAGDAVVIDDNEQIWRALLDTQLNPSIIESQTGFGEFREFIQLEDNRFLLIFYEDANIKTILGTYDSTGFSWASAPQIVGVTSVGQQTYCVLDPNRVLMINRINSTEPWLAFLLTINGENLSWQPLGSFNYESLNLTMNGGNPLGAGNNIGYLDVISRGGDDLLFAISDIPHYSSSPYSTPVYKDHFVHFTTATLTNDSIQFGMPDSRNIFGNEVELIQLDENRAILNLNTNKVTSTRFGTWSITQTLYVITLTPPVEIGPAWTRGFGTYPSEPKPLFTIIRPDRVIMSEESLLYSLTILDDQVATDSTYLSRPVSSYNPPVRLNDTTAIYVTNTSAVWMSIDGNETTFDAPIQLVENQNNTLFLGRLNDEQMMVGLKNANPDNQWTASIVPSAETMRSARLSNFIGIAEQSVDPGQLCTVTLPGGVTRQHDSLKPGRTYVLKSGRPTIDSDSPHTGIVVGKAIGKDRLLVK